MPPPPRFVVADGPIKSATFPENSPEAAKYVFKFTSKLVLCNTAEAGQFENKVKCRKWTDLSGNVANTPCRVAPPEPPQPPRGCIVNVGDVTLKIDPPQPRTIVCPDFKLQGTQTHGTEGAFVVFLFTGQGESEDDETVSGVGSCLETLVPDGPPKVDSWHFVFTIC